MTEPLSIRSLADCRTTLDHVRSVVVQPTPATNLVLVQGLDSTIQFPRVCPNCGLPANSKLRIQRGFVICRKSGDETPDATNPTIDEFDVPFCAACVQRQRTELIPLSPWTPLKRGLSEC